MSEEFKHNRRRFLRKAVMTIAVAEFGMIGSGEAQFNKQPSGLKGEQKMSQLNQAQSTSTVPAVRPFRVNMPEVALADLRRRIASTRWPDPETVTDQSQGVQLATMKELVRHWQTDYDWRKVEAKLNGLPQFVTTIDGLDIHFIHVRSKHDNALPLIVTHGWPGSVIEQLKIIDPLTYPTAHRGSASDAFHLVIPSIPGYGFSARPTTTGWGPDRTARAWVADEAPWIHAICGARRRFGRGCLHRDGQTGASRIAGHSY
jgi:epoxide hydrolase-like protein